jgi:hypothetical protein
MQIKVKELEKISNYRSSPALSASKVIEVQLFIYLADGISAAAILSTL